MKPIELLLATLPLLGAISAEQVQAQVAPPVVEGTGTTVAPNSQNPNQLDIRGGQTSSDGANLFHSFEQFGLNQGQIANFIQSNADIQNILARVSGGNASLINGILQVTNGNTVGSANLFLVNPSGIIFGPNASLNLNGAFTATTANGVGFGTNGSNWFSATGANNYASLTGTPSAFAFTMEQPGAIINAGNLSVGGGKSLTLLAGTVANTGRLSAPGSQITVAAVPGKSVVRLSQAGNVLSLDIQSPITPSPGPNNWTLPILSLPQILTGGGGGNATGLAVNKNGQVELIGSNIRVENGDVVVRGDIDTSSSINAGGSVALSAQRSVTVTGDIKTSAPDSNQFLSGYVGLTATKGDINVGNIRTGSGGSIKLLAMGNINGANINAGYFVDDRSIDTSVQLSSSTGDIVVKTIEAGPGGIDVTAFGIFQARETSGTFPGEERITVKDNPELIEFLVSQGIPREKLINSGQVKVFTRGLPGSIIVRPSRDGRGSITIRHAGASKTGNTLSSDRINITPTDKPFRVGPNITKLGEAFRLDNGVAIQDFGNEGFSLVRNESYDTIDLSNNNSSGTAGAIIIGFGGNSTLVSSLSGRTFSNTGSPPPITVVRPPVVENKQPRVESKTGTNNTNDTDNQSSQQENNPDSQQPTQTAMGRQPETLDFGILVLDKSLVASLESKGHATRLSVGSDGNGELTGSDLEAEEEKKISLNQRLSTYPGIYITDNSYGNVQK